MSLLFFYFLVEAGALPQNGIDRTARSDRVSDGCAIVMTVVVASGVVVVNFVVIGVAGDQLDDDGVCLDDDEDGDDAHVGREGECGVSGAAPGKVMSFMLKKVWW